MNILFITTYFEPNQGATSVLLSRLAKQLQARGHSLTILTTAPHYPLGKIADSHRHRFSTIENRNGLMVIQTWLWATPSSRISRKLLSQLSFMFTAILRGLRIQKPDVVFIEAQPIFTSLAGVFLSRLKNVPYVLNVSDLWPDHMLTVGKMTETHSAYKLARLTVDATYRGAAAIVSASPVWDAIIQKYVGPTDKTSVIYYGVDLDMFRPALDSKSFRDKYQLGNNLLITFIGTFATQYDFDTMLEVAGRFRHRQDVHFVFIGEGSQSDLVKERLSSGTSQNIKWVKWIDHSEMPLAWNASDVTFWALRKQDLYRGTIPGKLYEAMACGTPIVAATEDVAARLITESGGGIATSFGDVLGMEKAISNFLDDKEKRKSYGKSARIYAEKHFDANGITQAYENILSQIVEHQGGNT